MFGTACHWWNAQVRRKDLRRHGPLHALPRSAVGRWCFSDSRTAGAVGGCSCPPIRRRSTRTCYQHMKTLFSTRCPVNQLRRTASGPFARTEAETALSPYDEALQLLHFVSAMKKRVRRVPPGLTQPGPRRTGAGSVPRARRVPWPLKRPRSVRLNVIDYWCCSMVHSGELERADGSPRSVCATSLAC